MALAERDREAVRARLNDELRANVVLEGFVGETFEATEGPLAETRRTAFRELLDDVASLSPHVTVVHHRWDEGQGRARALGVVRPSAIALVAPTVRGRMIQYGTPAGFEFRSFLSGIVAAANGGGEAIDSVARQLMDQLPEHIHLQVFTSPGCPHCPKMAELAYQLAANSSRFAVDVIDATEFQELAQRYEVRGIPLTVVNDVVEVVGAMPVQTFLKRLIRENVPARRGISS
jgi:alkyl hydroperoxide reductase subunit AhpF